MNYSIAFYDSFKPSLNELAAVSFWTGIAAAFLYQFAILPATALVTGVMAVSRNDPGRLTGKWRAWIGLILGIVYSLLALTWYLRSWAGG